ncbi:MAG: 2-C-methyl-D-erythritol 2,4-cyclodiphosphate synthase [Planctomycetota bacterium]
MPRIGLGFDIHRLVEGRPLVLAGMRVQDSPGLLGYSDGDVVLHAVIDGIFGAAGLSDIGDHFPSGDPAFAGIASTLLLEKALEEVTVLGLAVRQVDVNVIAETPRLGTRKNALKANLARLLRLPEERVAIKARTMEGLGEIGAGRAIAAQAIVLLEDNA